MPPELKIGLPKARCVVELTQPPAADRNQDDYNELQPFRGQKRSPLELVNQRVDEKNVAGPDNRREPVADNLIAGKQQRFGTDNDRDSDVAVGRKSRCDAGSVHARSIMRPARISNLKASRPGGFKKRSRAEVESRRKDPRSHTNCPRNYF